MWYKVCKYDVIIYYHTKEWYVVKILISAIYVIFCVNDDIQLLEINNIYS
jgi:hypothetical protein